MVRFASWIGGNNARVGYAAGGERNDQNIFKIAFICKIRTNPKRHSQDRLRRLLVNDISRNVVVVCAGDGATWQRAQLLPSCFGPHPLLVPGQGRTQVGGGVAPIALSAHTLDI